jgi:hypothetical protein
MHSIYLCDENGIRTGHILSQYPTREEAEEALANIANEDGILTETAYAGRRAEIASA